MTEIDTGVDAWISRLQNAEREEARADAAEELGEFGGEPAVAALTLALSDPSNTVRVSAALALGELRAIGASAALRLFLTDPEPNLRGAAAVALGQIGGPDTAPLLLTLERDPVLAVRGAAAWALGTLGGTLGDSMAYDALARLSRDTDADVADAAQEALRRWPKPPKA